MVDYLEETGLKESAATLEREAKVDAAEKVAAKGLLEKKWSSVLRLQKKMMQLEEENKQLRENAANVGPKRPTTQLLPVAPPVHVLKARDPSLCLVFCVRFAHMCVCLCVLCTGPSWRHHLRALPPAVPATGLGKRGRHHQAV